MYGGHIDALQLEGIVMPSNWRALNRQWKGNMEGFGGQEPFRRAFGGHLEGALQLEGSLETMHTHCYTLLHIKLKSDLSF